MIWRPRRLLRRAATIGALVAFVLLAGSITASAHSYFIQSDPADGSIIEKAPHRVVLVFSSAVAASFTSIQLVEAGGAHYTPTEVVAYPGQPNIVVVSLPQIPNGSYRLTFATRDTVDLHQTVGTLVFGVGVAPSRVAAVPNPIPPQPMEVLLRWIALAGLAGVLGGISLALGVVDRLPDAEAVRARVQRSLFRLALAGAALVLIGGTGQLVLQASSLGPVAPSVGRLLSSSEFGTRYLVTVLLLAGLTPLLLSLWIASARKQVPSLMREIRKLKAWFFLGAQFRVVVLGVGLTAAVAFSGHVAGASGNSIGGVTLLTLHVGAMGVWAGGVAALTLTLLALRHATGRLDRMSVMALVVGFGQIAAVAFATLGVTGLLLSGLQVASITALLSTQYGMVLIAKVGLIGVVALLGLRHAIWTWRGLRRPFALSRFPSRLPLTVALEAAGAIVVVLFASMLGASAPAQGLQFDPPQSGPAITQFTQQDRNLLITLSVKPNRPGPNLVSVVVSNTSWPATPARAVTVLVKRPGDITQGEQLPTTPSARPAGAAFGAGSTATAFDAGSVKLDAGDVRFIVTVQRHGFADSVASVLWQVAPVPVPRAPVVVSNQRLAPIVDLAAVLAGLVAAVLVFAGVVRRRQAVRLPASSEPLRSDRQFEPGRPSTVKIAPRIGWPARRVGRARTSAGLLEDASLLAGHNGQGGRTTTPANHHNKTRTVSVGSPSIGLSSDD